MPAEENLLLFFMHDYEIIGHKYVFLKQTDLHKTFQKICSGSGKSAIFWKLAKTLSDKRK